VVVNVAAILKICDRDGCAALEFSAYLRKGRKAANADLFAVLAFVLILPLM